MEKITKKVRFMQLQDLIAEAEDNFGGDVEFDFRGLNEFCANEIAQLDKKAAKAKERAEKNKAKPDELIDLVQAALTNEPQTRDEIVEAIQAANPELETATSGRVVTRLTALIKAGIAVKESVTVGEPGAKHKVMVYSLAPVE